MSNLPESVWQRAAALNTWGTNAIEGNTLDRHDVERLLLDGVAPPRPRDDVIETIQHEAAFRGLIGRTSRPPDLVTVLELHEAVFRGLPRHAPGQWRRTNVYITGSRHRPPRHEKVIPQIEAWIEGWNVRLESGHDAIAAAAWSHAAFERIHPFTDGNGRVGRLLLNLHLLIHGLPPVHILPPDRDAYLDALAAADRGDLMPLEHFLAVRLDRSLLDLLDQVGGPEDELLPLSAFVGRDWNPYDTNYLGLRARQGALPAVHLQGTSAPAPGGRLRNGMKWLTSERALRAYVDHVARRDALARLRP